MAKHPENPGVAPEEYEWPDDARTPMTETEGGQSKKNGEAKNGKEGTEGGVCRTDDRTEEKQEKKNGGADPCGNGKRCR